VVRLPVASRRPSLPVTELEADRVRVSGGVALVVDAAVTPP
jgi:2-polyprenyl-6-methoxyphenol hydroxylase-like FAD-dependent oxidoreductase